MRDNSQESKYFQEKVDHIYTFRDRSVQEEPQGFLLAMVTMHTHTYSTDYTRRGIEMALL